MRIAYLDCFAGISGDMFLGALLGAGVPLQVMQDAAAAMHLGASLKVETVDRSGISSVKVHVLEDGILAESTGSPSHQMPAIATGAASFEHQHTHTPEPHTHQLKTQHLHKTGHAHDHPHTHPEDQAAATHTHVHGRSLTVIRALIDGSTLSPAVKSLSTCAFNLLGASEAKIHNVPVDEIHFHEVGAIDAIIDIVCASAGIVHLNVGRWHSSPVNVGGGMVVCAHGTFPVPAPATADLLRGIPTYSAHVQKELVTPTGAALLRAIEPAFGQQPAMQVAAIGYGAGTRNPVDFPNVLRLSVGEDNVTTQSAMVTVLETALDDATPQLLAHVTEQALKLGALDVMLTPVVMKKGRPGTLLTILANPADTAIFERLILRETTTLGVRIRQDRRTCLDRAHVAVQTPYGQIRVKTGAQEGEILNATPEYEDCRVAAEAHQAPLKAVQQSALNAYAARMGKP